MHRNIDELTLQLLASALTTTARRQEGVRGISVQPDTAGLVFELDSGRNVVVSVLEDDERFYFLIGKQEASVKKRDMPFFGGIVH
jgi:L-arabinose isomerase